MASIPSGRSKIELTATPPGTDQPDQDVPVVPVLPPEGEAPVPRVLQVQVNPDGHVVVDQRARLDEQRLAALEVADEGVARRVE